MIHHRQQDLRAREFDLSHSWTQSTKIQLIYSSVPTQHRDLWLNLDQTRRSIENWNQKKFKSKMAGGAAGGFVTRALESMLKECSGKKYTSLQTAIQSYLGLMFDLSGFLQIPDLQFEFQCVFTYLYFEVLNNFCLLLSQLISSFNHQFLHRFRKKRICARFLTWTLVFLWCKGVCVFWG